MRWPAHFIDAHESRHEKSHFDASFAEPIPFISKNYVLGGRNVLQGTINQTTKSRRNPPNATKKSRLLWKFCLAVYGRSRGGGGAVPFYICLKESGIKTLHYLSRVKQQKIFNHGTSEVTSQPCTSLNILLLNALRLKIFYQFSLLRK